MTKQGKAILKKALEKVLDIADRLDQDLEGTSYSDELSNKVAEIAKQESIVFREDSIAL